MANSSLENNLLLRAARNERTERTPVWLMRQAGRFDPAYQEIKKNCQLPLEDMFAHAELAAEVTVLPVRYGVDAAILFQDILTPLGPFGCKFVFQPGPKATSPLVDPQGWDRLAEFDPAEELPFIPRSITLAKQALAGKIPLLGFAGAPLTLATFLAAGGSPGHSAGALKKLVAIDEPLIHRTLKKLADMTAAYLLMQIEAGVDAIQLFESVADLYTREEYERLAHPYHCRVLEQLSGKCPTILFVKERPFIDLMSRTTASVLSVGKCVDIADARASAGGAVAFQGNFDNDILRAGTLEEIDAEVHRCLTAGGQSGYILNLNHGVHKDTPPENVRRLIEVCKAAQIRKKTPANT